MTDPFAPVEPSSASGPQLPGSPSSASAGFRVSTPPPPVIAPKGKGDRAFRVLLAVGLIVAVGGVAFAVGRVTAPAAAATTRGGLANGGFGNGTAGAVPSGLPGAAFGRGAGIGGGVLVTGTVDAVSGTTMTLKEANGTTMTVNLAGTTTYHAQAAATAADVTVGKQVQVEVDIAGGFGGPGFPGASPGAANPAASPAAGGSGTTPRAITARDVTLVTP
jgi:hypothetical protein